MQLETTSFTATYQVRKLSSHDLARAAEEVQRQLPHVRMTAIEIEPRGKGLKFGTSRPGWRQLERALARYDKVRKYALLFKSRWLMPKENIWGPPWLKVVVRVQDYVDDPSYPRITVEGYGSSESDYERFRESIARVLCLTPHCDYEEGEFAARSILTPYFRLPMDEVLRAQTSGAMQTRQYDVAIKAAITLVETRLREKCVNSGGVGAQEQAGVDLAITAFHKERGCLTPPWPLAAEACQGAQLLFQGFFMYLRNAYAHNAVVMGSDSSVVLPCLATCQFLLELVERSSKASRTSLKVKT